MTSLPAHEPLDVARAEAHSAPLRDLADQSGIGSRAAKRQSLVSLQALRGFAATLVVLLHTGEYSALYTKLGIPFPQWINSGHAGVDIFFVLSGFIIYYAHRQDIGTGKLREYALKRFVRIYPIYWVVMLAVLAISFFTLRVNDGNPIEPGHFIKSFFLIPQRQVPVVRVSWTLVHEVRFYIIFGIFIILGPKPALFLSSSLLVLSAAVLAVHTLAPERIPAGALGGGLLFVLHPSNIEFGLGALAASLALGDRTPRWIGPIAALIGAVSICIALQFHPRFLRSGIRYATVLVFALPSFCLVLGCALVERRWSPRLPRVLVAIGDASYSIYLIHKPLLSLIPPAAFVLAATAGSFTLFGGMGIVSIGAGIALFRLCERPLLRVLRARLRLAR